MLVSSRLAFVVFISSLGAHGTCAAESREHLADELSLLQLRARLRRSAGGVDTLPAVTAARAADVVIDSSLDAMLHSVVEAALAAAHDARAAGADEAVAALVAAEAVAREEAVASLAGGGGEGVPAPALLEASSTTATLGDLGDGGSEPRLKLAAPLGSCGPDFPSNIQDCHRVDFGSCGNACCNLLLTVPFSPATAVKMLNETLSDGGPDGRYHLEASVEGSTGFANLTDFTQDLPDPFSKSTSGLFIGQVRHETIGHFNDTVDFNLIATKNGDTLLHAFSLSLVAGALGDNGQNYKNIISPVKAAFGHDFKLEARLFNSCPDADEVLLGPRITSKEDLDMAARLRLFGLEKAAASAPDTASVIQVNADTTSEVGSVSNVESNADVATTKTVMSADEVVRSESEQVLHPEDGVDEVPSGSTVSEEVFASESGHVALPEVTMLESKSVIVEPQAADVQAQMLAAAMPAADVPPADLPASVVQEALEPAEAKEQERPQAHAMAAAMPVKLVRAAETQESDTEVGTVEVLPVAADFEMSTAPRGSVAEVQPVDVPSADEIVAAEATMLETAAVSQLGSGAEAKGTQHQSTAAEKILATEAAEAPKTETLSAGVVEQVLGHLSLESATSATPVRENEKEEEGEEFEAEEDTDDVLDAGPTSQAAERASSAPKGRQKLLTALLAISSERKPGHATGLASAAPEPDSGDSSASWLPSWVAETAKGVRIAAAKGVAEAADRVKAAVSGALDEDEKELHEARKEAKRRKAKLDRRDSEWKRAKAAADAVPESDTSGEEEVELSKKSRKKGGKAIFTKKQKGQGGSVLAKKNKKQGDPILAVEKPEPKAKNTQMREEAMGEVVGPTNISREIRAEDYMQLDEVQSGAVEKAFVPKSLLYSFGEESSTKQKALASATLRKSGLYEFGLANSSAQGIQDTASPQRSKQKGGQSGLYAFGGVDASIEQESEPDQVLGESSAPAPPAMHKRSRLYAFGEEGAVFDVLHEEEPNDDQTIKDKEAMQAKISEEHNGLSAKGQRHVERKEEREKETQTQIAPSFKADLGTVAKVEDQGHSTQSEVVDGTKNAGSKSGFYAFSSDRPTPSEEAFTAPEVEAKIAKFSEHLSKREAAVQELQAKQQDVVTQLVQDAVDDALKVPPATPSPLAVAPKGVVREASRPPLSSRAKELLEKEGRR